LLQKEFKEHNIELKDIVDNQKNFDLITKKFAIKNADELIFKYRLWQDFC